MSGSLTRCLALSLAVCCVTLLAAPAFAAGPSHGLSSPAMQRRSPVSAGFAGRGIHLFTSLEAMALPAAGPLLALTWAGRVAGRFLFPMRGTNPVGFIRNLSRGTGPRAMNRSAFPGYQGSPGAATFMGIGASENLTASLAGKGYDVADMQAALSRARTALAASNTTAYRAAMTAFREDLGTKVAAGTIPRTAIADYLKTLPAANRVPGRQGVRVMGRGFMPRGFTNQTGPGFTSAGT